MLFFTDALDGQTPTVSPAADSEKLYDRSVRTGASANTFTFTWTSIDYHAVVLVLKNATAWTLTPNGTIGKDDPDSTTDPPAKIAAAQSGTLTASEVQYVYVEYQITGGTQLVVTTTGGEILEVYVLKLYLDMTGNADRPMRYYRKQTDPGRRAYRSEDDTLVFYSGLTPRGKAECFVGWDYLPLTRVNQFRDLFLGPPVRDPFFFYPEPDRYPGEVYRVYWINDFDPRPSAGTLQAGYTLDLHLVEI